jgi:hypothetical protein
VPYRTGPKRTRARSSHFQPPPLFSYMTSHIVTVSWRSWLSHLSHTQKVLGSNPSEAILMIMLSVRTLNSSTQVQTPSLAGTEKTGASGLRPSRTIVPLLHTHRLKGYFEQFFYAHIERKFKQRGDVTPKKAPDPYHRLSSPLQAIFLITLPLPPVPIFSPSSDVFQELRRFDEC